MFIIGFTGTNGAGKTTLAKYLVKKGFIYHSLSDILREKLKEQGIKENIDNLLALGNKLRKENGAGMLAKMTLEKIQKNNEEKATVDSIRHPEEVRELRKAKKFFSLTAIEAPIKLRYKRVSSRKRTGDSISFEKFKKQEESQLEGKNEGAQLLKCIDMADFKIVNNGSLEKLYKSIEEILKKI